MLQSEYVYTERENEKAEGNIMKYIASVRDKETKERKVLTCEYPT